MSIWEMSLSGGILILVILVLRGLFQNRLPRQTFLALWMTALLRLLVPFSLPADYSIYHLLESAGIEWTQEQWIKELQEQWSGSLQNLGEGKDRLEQTAAANTDFWETAEEGFQKEAGFPDDFFVWREIFKTVYLWGVLLCAVCCLSAYLKCYREFRISLPVKNAWIQKWAEHVPLRRKIQVRQSEVITTPVTYGVFYPVILLPKNMDWEDTEQLQFVLTHEAIHIRRLDVVKKMLLTAALCIYWFHPLVWIMYGMANRDLELSCDEAVIRRFGQDSRAAYACALICLAERKNSRIIFGNSFSKNAMEERIVAIMKKKKITIGAAAGGIALVIAAALFAASVQPKEAGEKNAVAGESQNKEENNHQNMAQEAVKEDPQKISQTVSEEADGTKDVWEDEIQKVYQEIYHSEEFSDYEKFGLSYDEKKGYFLYKDEMVGYFKDEMSPGLYRKFSDEKGEIGLVVSRDEDGTMTGFQEKDIEEVLEQNGQITENSARAAAVDSSEIVMKEFGDTSEEGDLVIEFPDEYAEYGVTWDGKYQGKQIAFLYDKNHVVIANGDSSSEAVYLEVRRDSKGKITSFQEVTKEEMQKILDDEKTGLKL